MRHIFCTLRDALLSLLLDPCPCPRCTTDREIEERAEEMADAAEIWANEGESS